MPSASDVLLVVAAVIATSGLLLFHLVILGWRAARRRFRAKREPVAGPVPATEAPPSIAFLVPVYNDALTIGPCIESILAQTHRPTEIVVVDDGSSDESAQVVANYEGAGVRLIRLDHNQGKTAAIEAGLRELSSELVAITDSDSLVDRRYIEEMLPAFTDPSVSAVAGNIESLPHTWVTASRQVDYMVNLKVQKPAEDAIDCLFVLPGVSTTYRRKVLMQLGFERDTIAEDIDMTFRFHGAGLSMRFNPRACVYTSDPPTLGSYFRQIVRWDTDIWTVVLKHRGQFGRTRFGTIGFPLLMAFHVASVAFVLGVPLYLIFVRPEVIVYYYAGQVFWDGVMAIVAAFVYRRLDVLWSTLSRFPTRVLARIATLVALGRIVVGRPMRSWSKLERRATRKFLPTEGAHLAGRTPPDE